jgi:uncharacterized protein (UPF0335 family)
MSGPDGVAGDRLRSFVERIERIDEDLKAMNDEKKDVFAEAKSEGFDVKILKEASLPDGVLPGRRMIATGRPVAVS